MSVIVGVAQDFTAFPWLHLSSGFENNEFVITKNLADTRNLIVQTVNQTVIAAISLEIKPWYTGTLCLLLDLHRQRLQD